MILLADSGSSKTHWCWLGDTSGSLYTQGINPYYISEKELSILLHKAFDNESLPVSEVYFFGAGCNAEEKNQSIKNAIQQLWPHVKVEVYSDLMASCVATSGGQPAICCILGTGSNSCLFDGEKIVDNVSPLGFILGDEGSGAYLGKQLINYLYKDCTNENLKADFENTYHLSVTDIIKRTYNDSYPNRFLAGFTPFLLKHRNSIEVKEMIHEGFMAFVNKNLLGYKNVQNLPIHFTGSVAHYFKEELGEVIKKSGLHIGNIVQYPMDGLRQYYQTKKA